MLAKTVSLVGLLLVASGCAGMPRDAGFTDVQEAVRERAGLTLEWQPEADLSETVPERVQSLLEQELSAESVVEIALLNNRNLQATYEELGIASAELMQARRVRNPILSGEIRFPDRPFEIALSQTLIDLIQLPRRRRQASAAVEVTKSRIAAEVMDLARDVRDAFYTLQAAEQARLFNQSIVDGARASAELAVRQHAAGNIADLDLENEQAVLEGAKLELAASEAEVLAGRERINGLLGLWSDQTTWAIAGKLPDLPPAELDLDEVERLAVTRRFDLAAARQEVEAAARAVPLARMAIMEDLAIGVHHEREPEGQSSTGPAFELPLPIFDQGQPARTRAEAVLRQSWQRHAALSVEARAEARSARDRLLAARNRVEYYHDVILPRRSRIVAYSQQHYNFMLIGDYQLLAAKREEIATHNESIVALRDYWIARAELEHAVGGRIDAVPPSEPEEKPSAPPTTPHANHDPHSGESR